MKKILSFIDDNSEVITIGIIFLCLFTLMIVITVAVSRESDFVKCIEANCVVKAANEHELMYYCTETEQVKTTEDGRFYKTNYIGYDEYHTYYSLEYLTATQNYEILQTVELNIFINPLYN